MKKFLLVTLIGMVIVLDIYGVVKEVINTHEHEEVIDKNVTIVYVE